MSDKNSGGSSKPFTQFLEECPAGGDEPQRVQVTGVVRRGDKKGTFVLRTADGQSHELEASMVERYTVVQETQAERVVQLELKLDKASKTIAEKLKPVAFDTLKEMGVDTLAINETYPAIDMHTLTWLDTTPLSDRHTISFIDTSPLADQHTPAFFDQGGPTTPIGDVKLGAYDTLEEGIGGGIDPTVNPALGGTPFVLATPHHAPTAEAMMRAMGGAAAAGMAAPQAAPKPVLSDAHTIIKEPIADLHTFKEVTTDTIKDAHTDPIYDKPTIKELIRDPITIWEGGGTPQEGLGIDLGGLVQPPVWNLPGMMF